MAGGFDFNALFQDPMFMIGLGLMTQQQQPGERPLAAASRGIAQGIGNLNTFQQMEQRKALVDKEKRALELRQQLAENIRARAAKPRPLAFEPQPGDEQVQKNYDEQNMIADIIAAGGSPDTYLTRSMMREQAAAEGARKSEEARLNREAQAKRDEDTLEERRLNREQTGRYQDALIEIRNAQIAQARALHGALSQNAAPVQIIGPDGQPMYVHPSQAYGKSPVAKVNLNIANEQKRKETLAAIEFADAELKKLDAMTRSNPRISTGPLSLVNQGYEAAMGAVNPYAESPAIDIRNKRTAIVSSIKKALGRAGVDSNQDINQQLEILGGGTLNTAGASVQSISSLRKKLRSVYKAYGGNVPDDTENQPTREKSGKIGGLTPAEQKELAELEAWKRSQGGQ